MNTMSPWLLLIALIVVAVLGWQLYRRFGSDRIEALLEKHRKDARLVSRGKFFDGNRQLDVALSLTNTTFFYENDDMQGYLDLQWIREVEYDNDLSTGIPVEGKVLRIRTQSQEFEFVLPADVADRWRITLGPRRASGDAPVSAELTPASSTT